MNIIDKITVWIKVNLATVLGIGQAGSKAIKEILTGIVNLLSIFVANKTASRIVANIRTGVNSIDLLIEEFKKGLLQGIV